MLHRFENGTIVDRIAGENIRNNDIYIIDPQHQTLRKPIEPNEWLTCQLAYVYNPTHNPVDDNRMICAGSACRCWIGYLVI